MEAGVRAFVCDAACRRLQGAEEGPPVYVLVHRQRIAVVAPELRLGGRDPAAGDFPAPRGRQAGGVVADRPASYLEPRSQTSRGRDHRGGSRVDGVDDLRAADALQVDRCDAEIRVSELALDDDQRHALMRHLHSVRVTELMRRETSPHPALAAVRPSCLGAEDDSQCRPEVAPRITHSSAPTGSRRRRSIHGCN